MGSALDGTRARGIDVYHGHPVVSYTTLEAAPEQICFIGIKASEGIGFTDPKLLWHQEGFRGTGFEMAVYYHFAEPGEPRVQARRFVDIVGPLERRERLCLDLERSPLATANGGMNRDWVDQFYDELAGGLCTDRRHFIYTSKEKWDEICGGEPWLYGTTDVDLWAKRYSTNADLEPRLPAPWKDRGYHIWQFSDGFVPPHSIAGVGMCDGNVWNGNRSSLKSYVDASSSGPAPSSPGGGAASAVA